MKTTIRDIIQRKAGDFYRFSINDYKNGRLSLIIDSREWLQRPEQLRVETSAKRLIQLANEILNYLNKKVKWEEWKPTMQELERRLEETYPNWGIERWFLDWVRNAVTLRREDDVKQARRIYEWLKGNEDWLYGRR